MINFNVNRVLDVQLVKSNEVGNSQRMEKEGLLRSIVFGGGRCQHRLHYHRSTLLNPEVPDGGDA